MMEIDSFHFLHRTKCNQDLDFLFPADIAEFAEGVIELLNDASHLLLHLLTLVHQTNQEILFCVALKYPARRRHLI